MSKQKLTDDDKKCIRNNINYSQNCNQNTDGKCKYEYNFLNEYGTTINSYSGSFNCKENDFFNVDGTDLVFQCPSTYSQKNIVGNCYYEKNTTTPTFFHQLATNPIYIIVTILIVIVIFLILFFALKSSKSSKSKK